MSWKVYQYDLEGNFISEYKSTRDAARKLKNSHSNISRCCNNIMRHSHGYIFKYSKQEVEPIINPNAVKKIVIEVDLVGIEINRWDSIMNCSRDTKINNGNLSRVCNGKSISAKGRSFKFLN